MIPLSDIQGHWVRHWIKAPGFEDHRTRVHWMQVGPDYADVRVPLDRPDLSGTAALSDLPAQVLCDLAKAEGFAGHVTLDGRLCTWHREINWHGEPEGLDVGEISFDPQGRMIETGVHAEYTELWARRDAPAAQAIRFKGGGYSGHLVCVGDRFVLGIGTVDKPSSKPLVSALQSGTIPQGIERLFDGIHAMGRWSDGTAIAEISTHPFCDGKVVATLKDAFVIWHRTAFDGTTSEIDMRVETVVA